MAATCSICALPAPTGLAMLAGCLHSFHTGCIRQYVLLYGRCPHAECGRVATEEDIRVLIFDPPQPNPTAQPNQDATAIRVWEVLNATMERLSKFSSGSDQERAQVAQVGEAFELVLREKNAGNNAGAAIAPVESGWDKLMRIIKSKEVKMVVLAAIFVLICAFFWYIVGPGGILAVEMGEMVTGLLATLRAFAPEIVASIAAAATMFFGFFRSKKLAED